MMTGNQIAARAEQIIEQVSKGTYVEDSMVELKLSFKESYYRLARRLAGHANSAHGEPILWIFGINESAGVVGANQPDMADWWAQVKKHFDGIVPLMKERIIHLDDGKSVVAIAFDTEDAPYVILNPTYGKQVPDAKCEIRSEIPWRESTSARSATQRDMLRLLAPTVNAPDVELLDCNLAYAGGELSLTMNVYVSSRRLGRTIIPFHKCHCTVEVSGCGEPIELEVRKLGARYNQERSGFDWQNGNPVSVRPSSSEVIIDGAGEVILRAVRNIAEAPQCSSLDSVVVLGYAMTNAQSTLRASFDATECSGSSVGYKWRKPI